MTTLVQTGTWPGWPGGVQMFLADDAAAAILTAARDYQAATQRNLGGDIAVLPVGCLRTTAEVAEMQWAFDHRHDGGANGARSAALYAHYNMDRASNARPSSTSPHLTGYCVDIADSGFLAWLIVNGARYGLRRTLVAENDVRHFQFFPGAETVALDVTSLNTPKADPPPTRKKNKMTSLYNVGGSATVALAGDSPGTPANWLETSSASLIASWEEVHGPLNIVNTATYEAWKTAYLSPLRTTPA